MDPVFYLGAPEPAWLGRTTAPLFMSYGRLRRLKRTLPRRPFRAFGWGLDSRGFNELRQHGRWTFTIAQYLEDVLRYGREIGGLEWAAQMDMMCEDEILAATGLTRGEHIRWTAAYYLVTDVLFARIDQTRHDEVSWDGNPIMPVLQGIDLADYHLCWDLMSDPDAATRAMIWELGGPGFPVVPVDMMTIPVVGVGSVCTRESTQEIADIVTSLYERGWNGETGTPLHAFGAKMGGRRRYADVIASSDSQSWSAHARHNSIKHDGCTAAHQVCNYCLPYALHYQERILATS